MSTSTGVVDRDEWGTSNAYDLVCRSCDAKLEPWFDARPEGLNNVAWQAVAQESWSFALRVVGLYPDRAPKDR